MKVQEFFDQATYTLTYLVFEPATGDAVVIDPVLDFDPQRAELNTTSVEPIFTFIKDHSLRVHYALETHAHADHVSAAQEFKRRLGAKVVIGERIVEVQKTFQAVFDLGAEFPTDGRQFDLLAREGLALHAGSLSIEVISTPGHTPACVTYKVEDAIFTGDALFIEDYGTGRCDFPNGSAEELYASVHEKLYALPDETRVYVGHDYQPGQRPLRFMTTVGESKRCNVQLRLGTTEEEFVRFRLARDASLRPPQLLFQSVQLNVNAGLLPTAHTNGRRYLSIPLDVFRPAALKEGGVA